MISTSTFASQYVPGEVIVKLKGKMSSANSKAFLGKAGNEKGLSLKGSFSSLNLHHYVGKPGQDVQQLVNELKNDPNVEYAEPNYIIHKSDMGEQAQIATPNEISALATASSAGAGGSYGAFNLTPAPIQALEGWTQLDVLTDRPIVAIIDSGMEMDHPALSNALFVNAGEIPNNGIDDDGNGYIDDVNGWNFADNTRNTSDCDGHGTHVAGIVRGVGQNLIASPAPLPMIRILPIKFLDCSGSGSTSDAIKAIYYAANMGARVINNSWGGTSYSQALHEAVAYAYSKRALVVVAAGNSANNNDAAPTYPASLDIPGVLTIAATNNSDVLAPFSNYGGGSVHMAAPGVSVFSTYIGGQFAYLSGTSMAAPFVAGVAALIIRERPEMSGYQAKQLTLNSVNSLQSLQSKVATSGRLNVLKTVTASKSAIVDGTQPTYTISALGKNRELASSISSGGSGCGLIKTDGDGGTKMGMGGDSLTMNGLFLALLAAPALLIWQMRRKAKSVVDKRASPRFEIDSKISLKIGDRDLSGAMTSISTGGASIQAEEWIEKGAVMTLTLESPDGKDQIQVQGRVVWSTETKSYGVQFMETSEVIAGVITDWTRDLSKQS